MTFLFSGVANGGDNLVYLVSGNECEDPRPRLSRVEVYDMSRPDRKAVVSEGVVPVGEFRTKHHRRPALV